MKLENVGRLPSLSSSKLSGKAFQVTRESHWNAKDEPKCEPKENLQNRNSLTHTPEEVDRPVKTEGFHIRLPVKI